MKQLKERLSNQVDAALNEHVRAAEGWANHVRLLFALTFVLAAAWIWNHPSNAKYIYVALTAAWLLAVLVTKAMKENAQLTTLLDVTITHLGLFAFVQQGLFPKLGAGIYLCYFPILAVAANRYRMLLVLQTAIYAGVGYAVISSWAGSPPWLRLAMLGAMTYVFVMGSRKPKTLIVDVAVNAAQATYEEGIKQKELELIPQVHQLFMPPPILDLPGLWCSSKHGAGTATNGDYFQLFETPRGPLVVLGDLGGEGFEAVAATYELHQRLTKLVATESDLPKIVADLNTGLFGKYQGRRPFTCVLAQWQGEQMRYVNAGHLPLIQMSKPQGAQITGHKQLPVTCDPVGLKTNATFPESVVPFPVRDQLVLYTDGVFAKLTQDRNAGIAEIEAMAERFSGGEVTTLCHRLFDCGQPGLEPNKDDATVVVVRRQPMSS